MGLMDKLTEIGNKTVEVAKNVGDKAVEVKDVAVLNNKIETEKRNIRNTYTEIGKRYFEKYGEDNEAEFYDLITKINDSKTVIAATEEEIQKVKSNY